MFTEFDVIVCIILLITTITAMVRGAIKEVLSIVSWGGSAFLTIYFYPYSLSFTQEHFTSSAAGSIAAVVIVFIIALIFCSSIAAVINAGFGIAKEGGLDRTIGMVLGFIKGLMIVSAIHYIVYISSEDKEDPEWLQAGETYGLTKAGANIYDSRFKEFIDNALKNIEKSRETDTEEIIEDTAEDFEEYIEEGKSITNDTIEELE